MIKKKFPWHKYPAIPDIIENTEFTTYEKAVAAVQTLAWLEDDCPHTFDGLPGVYRFDMTKFHDPNNYIDGKNCGTACCIAGAMCSYMNHEGTLVDNDGYNISIMYSDIEEIFNVEFDDGSELDKLFYPKSKNGEDVRKLSAKVAARGFRRYLETGKVNYRA